ncbi:hypothetical protein B0H19DRAFT_1376285, partial [Mycena capillaripes]
MQTVTPPISRLPADVLIEIFMATQPEVVQSVGKGLLPVLLLVSKPWKALACDVPALWSSFSCALFPGAASGVPNAEIVERYLELVDRYLQRSRAAPLSVQVDGENPHRGPVEPAGLLISLLAAHSEQLYSLRLTGNGWSPVLLQGLRDELPNLEILQLPGSLGKESYGEFEIAPRLHTLILDNSYTRELSVPFPQIRSLHLLTTINPSGLDRLSHI